MITVKMTDIEYKAYLLYLKRLRRPEKLANPAQQFMVMEKDSESEYKLIGLNTFFDTEDDKNVNWEEYFGIK